MSKEEGRPEFTFYDGPPFATGMPHYGHILAGTIKVRSFSGAAGPRGRPCGAVLIVEHACATP
jgi:hypothetical protein